jgi:hypothetical protein
MSTYLRNLVARTIGVADVVRPNRASRFAGREEFNEPDALTAASPSVRSALTGALDERYVSADVHAGKEREWNKRVAPARESGDPGEVQTSTSDRPLTSRSGSILVPERAGPKRSSDHAETPEAVGESAAAEPAIVTEYGRKNVTPISHVDSAAIGEADIAAPTEGEVRQGSHRADSRPSPSHRGRIDQREIAPREIDERSRTKSVNRTTSIPISFVDSAAPGEADAAAPNEGEARREGRSADARPSPLRRGRFEQMEIGPREVDGIRVAPREEEHEIATSSRTKKVDGTTPAAAEANRMAPREVLDEIAESRFGPGLAGHIASRRRVQQTARLRGAEPELEEPEPTFARDEPVINVSIGHIEVRVPAAPQLKMSPRDPRTVPSPSFELDAYLRARNEGHR